MKRIKRLFVDVIELVHLILKNKSYYFKYYFKDKKLIYSKLRSKQIFHIHPISIADWKLHFNVCYFSGQYKENGIKNKVFIKVMGPNTVDCYYNEQIVNKYIDEKIPNVSNVKPRLIFADCIDDYYILCYECVKMDKVQPSLELKNAIEKMLQNYSAGGILHTDFGLVNIGKFSGGGYCFFDYGTSLCIESDRIRVRNTSSYNHKNSALPEAKYLLPDFDFYYDDAIHCGIDGLNRNNINFIVGKGDRYIAKLANKIIYYHLEHRCENSTVFLLCKDEIH